MSFYDTVVKAKFAPLTWPGINSAIMAEVALNRFGYGAQKDELDKIANAPQQWLLGQLKNFALPANAWRSEDAIQGYFAHRKLKQDQDKKGMKEDAGHDQKSVGNTSLDVRKDHKQLRKELVDAARSASVDIVYHAIRTESSFQSRLLDFFSNHFSVSAANLKMSLLAPTLEREAIAPNLMENFADMLIAVETHPAMLVYLNNEQSAGPDAKGVRRKKHGGLNENLAREIFELHTLGVDGGYLQQDVRELAMAISGWSISNLRKAERPGFRFKEHRHQPGSRTILGKQYLQSGVEQGKSVLKDLAVHPATARFVSNKLVRHFISDDAPQSVVDAMSERWLKTSGNLKAVLEVMILHPDSWHPVSVKLKTPREFVISACRACGITHLRRPDMFRTLTLLGQRPFSAGSPAGYGDTAVSWDGAEALLTRIEWASHFSAKAVGDPLVIAKQSLGSLLSNSTEAAMRRAESRQQSLALLLMSPDFQRR